MIGDPLMGGSPAMSRFTPDEMQETRNELDDVHYEARTDSITFTCDGVGRWWARVLVEEGWCRSVAWFEVSDQEALSEMHAQASAKVATASEVFNRDRDH